MHDFDDDEEADEGIPLDDQQMLDQRELPDPSDMDADDHTLTVPCPYCKNFIDEQSEVCPRCGNFILDEDYPSSRFPRWITIGIVLVLLIMVFGWVL